MGVIAKLEYVGPAEALLHAIPHRDGVNGRLYAYRTCDSTVQSIIQEWRDYYKPTREDFAFWPVKLDGCIIREAIHNILTPHGWTERDAKVDFRRHFRADHTAFGGCNGDTALAVLLLIRQTT